MTHGIPRARDREGFRALREKAAEFIEPGDDTGKERISSERR